MSKDDDKLATIIAEAKPKTLARTRISTEVLLGQQKSNKAVLFIPEDSDLGEELDIEVVGLDAAALAAMAARRC